MEQGHSVIVVEHNLEVIKCADWVIDLGPEGGASGGYIVAEGTPEQVACTPSSVTGQYLRELLLPQASSSPCQDKESYHQGDRVRRRREV